MDFIEKKSEFKSKQIRIGKLRRKWISTENTFLEKEKTETSDWYWSPEEHRSFTKV